MKWVFTKLYGVIFLIKKFLVFLIIVVIFTVFFIPSIAEPSDVALDQQVELGIPGTFSLIDTDHDQKAESLKFSIAITAYREGDFLVTGNLEGMKNGHWVALATTVVPFKWSPQNTTVDLGFLAGNIIKYKISGPYRVTVALKEGGWELPAQIAGFSEKLSWQDFNNGGTIKTGEISTMAKAKLAAETWAKLKSINTGSLQEINYDYDRWQLDYQGKSGEIMRFLVSPKGTVELLRINETR